MKNLFCRGTDLINEATVEALFVDRLLIALNYPDDKVRRKQSIEQITIGRGRKKENYKPDYVLLNSGGEPIIVLDAKGPDERPQGYHYQVSSYALYLNQRYPDRNPVLYVAVTNGHLFVVYPWDSDRPIFFLRFDEFTDGNEKFLEVRSNLSYSAFEQIAATKDVFDFQRPSLTTLIRTFSECHNLIWKKEKISPTDAFYEFCKIMFIKIREDNKIHAIIDKGRKPQIGDFVFSTQWIDSESAVEPHPFNAILFRQVRDKLEREIQHGEKKRIFQEGEELMLKPSTTWEVVRRLQNFDLYGIDEDLNGRMFETFLNATVRGKDLGQFFTPRGVVHYMAETAPLAVSGGRARPLSEGIPYVLDGCCGSGGFLIDAMAQFMRRIGNLSRLTDKERKDYVEEVRNSHLYGIEANPKIARIARLNMYLHGDGGSKIFQADTLDKSLQLEPGMSEEVESGIKELRAYVCRRDPLFDVVLTNPPFSMKYESHDPHEGRILQQYAIARTTSGATSASEKSNVLFLERYMDLLKPGTGEILTIIDDTVLNGDNSQRYRDFILDNFILIQVVSLPFNTFFRAGANIKTSMIHLRRKKDGEQQGAVFMAVTNNIGHDDHCRATPGRNNLQLVAKLFDKWVSEGTIEEHIIDNEDPREPLGCPLQVFEVPPDRLSRQRLDAFYYAPELRRAREKVLALQDEEKIIVKRGWDFKLIPELKQSEVAACAGQVFKYFEIGDVTRDGTIVRFLEDYLENLPTRARLRVKKGDVVFAKNNSSRGTTVLIPDWFDGGLVTTGFIGVRPRSYEEALILWNAFESEFFRQQVYCLAITASQPEVRENIFQNEMLIPWPKDESDKQRIIRNAQAAESARRQLRDSLTGATTTIDALLH